MGKIYGILSDDEKKKNYDETGKIDGEDFDDTTKDWDEYFRTMFKKININRMEQLSAFCRNAFSCYQICLKDQLL